MNRRTLRLPLTLAGLLAGGLALASSHAYAASETYVAPFLHGELNASFAANVERSRLYQYGVNVGTLQEGESSPDFRLRLGVLPGVELFADIPYVSNGSRTYKDVSAMCGDTLHPADPNSVDPGYPTGTENGCPTGSMVYIAGNTYLPNATATNLIAWQYSGIDDVVIGFHFAPLHEDELGKLETGRAPSKRAFPPMATWRLELGFIVGSGGNLYTDGPGAGGGGLRLGTSFSKHVGEVAEPYFSFTHDRFGPYTYAGVDPVSSQTVSLSLQSPNRTRLMFGVELSPFRDPATGARFSVDFAGGAVLLSNATVISGSKLPVVLTSGNGQAGTTGTAATEQSELGFVGRLGLNYQLIQFLRVEAGGELGYVMPHQLEASYNVEQGSHIMANIRIGLATSF